MYKIVFILLYLPLFSNAQKNKLLVEGVSPNLYINHKVEAKENYYSIGRIYNISPRDIAPFNHLQLEGGLTPGQNLKIPIGPALVQEGTAATDETFIPVYYLLKDKEGLYRVAQNHNNLPLGILKKWNKIKGETVKKGAVLIIGYLKVKSDASPLAKNGIGTVIQSDDADAGAATPSQNENKTDAKSKDAVASTVKPEQATAAKEEATTVKVENKEPVKPDIANVEMATDKKSKATKKIKAGAFKPLYDSQLNEIKEEGDAGIFKSTSGWNDKKYYCLHNSAAPGSIIKVTNQANGKFIFAKVLDLIPDIKQNNGLVIIINST